MKSLILALTAAAVLSLAGCASTPGATGGGASLHSIALDSVTALAVTRVIERDSASAEKRAERAARIVTIASTLQALGADALETLPQVTQALAPLLDKADLSPAERIQADILVQALVAAALERVKVDNGTVTYATINTVLTNVIKYATAYLPEAERH